MKIQYAELMRWVISPILAACLFAFCVTPAYPAKPAEQAAQPPVAASAVPASTEIAELSKQVEELKAKEREHYTMMMESERKTIDWWFSFLGVITAVLAIGGAFIPWLMGRKDKADIAKDKADIALDKVAIEKMQTEITASLSQTRQHETDAEQSAETAKRHAEKAKENREKTDGYISGQPISNPEELKESLALIQQDPTADPIVRLRAEAISASEAKEADKAYSLWNALTKLAPDDADDHFNAGYWAQDLGTKLNSNELIYWMKQAGEHYRQCLTIAPQAEGAAYNWGNALNAEAKAIAASDLPNARKLWQQAGEQYESALAIKPDLHGAANNWGVALDAEAKAIAASDLPNARKRWQQAGDQYQLALAIKPDKHEAATNWGIALDAEAKAIAASDLPNARKLWQQAGEQHQLALAIKPDMHEAATNWAAALMYEATELTKINNDGEAALLRNRAEQILLRHADAAPQIVGYNLACVYGVRGDVTNCLKWLNTCYKHKTSLNCAHLKTDTDLDSVRTTPEFIAWLQTICPDSQAIAACRLD